jgi:hypothetical protein
MLHVWRIIRINHTQRGTLPVTLPSSVDLAIWRGPQATAVHTTTVLTSEHPTPQVYLTDGSTRSHIVELLEYLKSRGDTTEKDGQHPK